ncbi:MAG: GDP-mannose 4,6-dehydratase [Patescibacteria group bacterium]|nr:GDP-mannose 4,6-dehydratase [Patescibacteria group bacterium]
MLYLVAGGAGFLGSHLCDCLIADGHDVLCVDNLITGKKDNIRQLDNNIHFTFWQYDITKDFNKEQEKLLSRVNAIFHLASPASPNIRSQLSYMNFPVETLLANSLGTYRLLEVAKKNRAKFLYASSSEIYGEPKEHPQKETYFGNVNPNGIRSCYDEGKRFGEAITFSYLRKYDINARVVRIFNTYGPKMDKEDGRVISNFITMALSDKPLTIYGDGTQTRSFCYVSDLINGLRLALEKENTKGEVFNLGNDEEYSIKELAEMVQNATGKKITLSNDNLCPDDPTRRCPDLGRAKKILGYKPEISLEVGLKKTVDYFKKIV